MAHDDGCWVKIYANLQFNDPMLKIVGPVDFPNLAGRFGDTWHDQIDSIKVGPDAIVRLYQNRNYQAEQCTFLCGEEVPDFGLLGFRNDADSMAIFRFSDLKPPYDKP